MHTDYNHNDVKNQHIPRVRRTIIANCKHVTNFNTTCMRQMFAQIIDFELIAIKMR